MNTGIGWPFSAHRVVSRPLINFTGTPPWRQQLPLAEWCRYKDSRYRDRGPLWQQTESDIKDIRALLRTRLDQTRHQRTEEPAAAEQPLRPRPGPLLKTEEHETESGGDPIPITPQPENGSPRPAGTQEPSLEERQPDAESESEPEPVSAEGEQPEEPSKAGAEPTKHKPLSEGEMRRLPERVTVKQAARALDCTQRNIRDRINRGTLPSQGKGTRKRIPRQAIWEELGIIPTPPTSSDG